MPRAANGFLNFPASRSRKDMRWVEGAGCATGFLTDFCFVWTSVLGEALAGPEVSVATGSGFPSMTLGLTAGGLPSLGRSAGVMTASLGKYAGLALFQLCNSTRSAPFL